jgi:hypothetical protein
MKKTFLALCSFAVLLYACKDEDVINNPNLTSKQEIQDHLFAEQTFSDVARIVEEGFLTPGNNSLFPSYNLINNNPLDVDTLIINFGTDCIYNQRLYTGKIVITYSGNYRDSLSMMTTTFENYHVNNNLVQGERIVTNEGRNSDGNMWFTIAVNNASITLPQNVTINWESNNIREWVNGQNTYSNALDDIYKISGTASGNSANGNDFTVKITSPLEIDLDCYSSCLVKSGIAKISPNGFDDRIINYGDSICDCNFDIAINGINYPILINY